MKLLLTSAGITNHSIAEALRSMLGKPTSDSKIVVVPTAHNPQRGDKSWVVREDIVGPHQLGWKEFSIIDLAAVNTLDRKLWWPQLEQADVLLFGGGNSFYLSYWMQRSGVFEAIPKWLETKVYVGISAGSVVASAGLRVDLKALESSGEFRLKEYDTLGPAGQSSAKTLGLVDFVFRPHLNSPHFEKIRFPLLEKVAKELNKPMYAIDDQSAIKIVDDSLEVISEGHWHYFE